MLTKNHPRNRVYYPFGQSLVEFALVLPLLVLILMGIFDLRRAIYASSVIANAAREGARARVTSRGDNTPITQAINSTIIGLDPNAMQIGYPPTPRNQGDPVTVAVTYTFRAITPLIGNIFGPSGNLLLSSTATMLSE